MHTLLQDVRYGLRALANRPAFSVLATLTLAVGVGVNTVAFSAINALLMKPQRFPGSDELARIRLIVDRDNSYGHASLPDFIDLARENRTLADLFAEARLPLSLRDGGRDGSPAGPAEQVWGLLVSTNYLSALRARPIIGRVFTTNDARGAELPVVVAERFWVERLGGGTSLAGRTIALNGRTFSIIGIMPEGFQGPGGLFEPDLWVSLERVELLGLSPSRSSRGTPWLSLVGRMKPGVTAAQAEADLQSVMAQLAASYPASHAGRRVDVVPFNEGVPELRTIARLSWLALGVVGIVLLIACFNVAGLLLARASERQREMGVRTALGASRSRILRQLVTEGVLLASISGATSLLLASWSADLLSAFSMPSPIPQRLHIPIDRSLVLFTLALVTIAGVLPALVPALQAMRTDVLKAIRQEPALGGRPSRLRNGFIVAQVAGSTLFLAAALLFLRSYMNTASFDPGFDTARTVVAELNPSSYGYDAARTQALSEQLLERVRTLPGVTHAALADRVPFSVGFPRVVEISAPRENCGTKGCHPATEYAVSPGHFAALGIPLVQGRDLTEQELRGGAAVAIVSQALATQLLPGEAAVGSTLRVGKERRAVEVIGVAADIKHYMLNEDPRWFIYRPLQASDYDGRVMLIARGADDPRLLTAAIQQQIRALDPALPPGPIKAMTDRMDMPLWPARTAAGFFVICGSLALVLATVGLFGVTYFAVNQRTREFGVRAALGATPQRVARLVVGEGLWLALPGVALGTIGAFVAMQLLARGLFGISPADPLTYAVTATTQAVVAIAACALPAYRAAKSDPMLALRQD